MSESFWCGGEVADTVSFPNFKKFLDSFEFHTGDHIWASALYERCF